MKYFFITILSILLLISCGDKKQYNEDEMKEYSAKGAELVSKTGGLLRTHLMMSIKEGGIGYAIGYCNEEALKLMDSVSKAEGVTIKRTSLDVRNPKDAPDTEEQKAISVFMEMNKKSETLNPILKKIDETTIAYFFPIFIDNPVCLNCHGQPGEEIDSTVFKTIKEFYPNDAATGYKLGDFRGIWSIKFNTAQK